MTMFSESLFVKS